MGRPEYQQRVIEERKELFERRDKLAEFINAGPGGIFESIDIEEKKRLYIQLSIMNQYIRILDERIEAFGV